VKRRDDPNQTLINWSNPAAAVAAPATSIPDPIRLAAQAPPVLVERLPWDFTTTFPQPSDEAIDAGLLMEDDCTPENIRSLHEEHTRDLLATLHELDVIMDARRHGVDSRTGKTPRAEESREQLRQFHEVEPKRLERAVNTMLEVYEEVFGSEAAHAFNRFIKATHAGIPVEIDHTAARPSQSPSPDPQIAPSPPRRAKRHNHLGSSSLPVPRPLPEAIKAGHFGLEADGTPVNPTPDEVRAVTEQHAEKIVALLDGRRRMERSETAPQCSDRARVGSEAARLKDQVKAEIDKYAASFGRPPAEQLERYCRRQVLADRGNCR
jgi:hypothetical protein